MLVVTQALIWKGWEKVQQLTLVVKSPGFEIDEIIHHITNPSHVVAEAGCSAMKTCDTKERHCYSLQAFETQGGGIYRTNTQLSLR